ncbi:diguanylate cyclase [Euzebya tangerina]|uniref:diguanylate cyclase n=1 Tax=Euzebya tangerina TaxID=591198 RepID=UPI0013C33B00|nr:diguanylate cyclase [Euzebya tangerina]
MPDEVDPDLRPELFELMVRVSTDGMLAIDPDGMVTFANAAAADLLGRDPDELIGTDLGLPLATGEAVEIELISGTRGVRVAELRVAQAGNGTQVAMLRDVSQRVRMRKELQRLALADQLTGVGNRRAFLALGEQALRVAQREGREALMVFIDIDDMKFINDRFGHRAGDRAVIETAHMLTRTVRDSDIVARVGGDEFCVLLTGTKGRPESLDEAFDRLESAASSIDDLVDFPLAVTIGAARFDPHVNPSISELMDVADAHMYREKRKTSGNMRVLVLGDQLTGAIVSEAVPAHHPIQQVETLEEALDRCRESSVDLIVVGAEARDLSEALTTLRSRPATTSLPVIVALSSPDIRTEETALDLGAADVINDGMPAAVIAARFRRAVGRG